jgi:uncharacterized protein (DUF1800 family)
MAIIGLTTVCHTCGKKLWRKSPQNVTWELGHHLTFIADGIECATLSTMTSPRRLGCAGVLSICLCAVLFVGNFPVVGQLNPPPPVITSFGISNSLPVLGWSPYPSAQAYTILTTTNLSQPFVTNLGGSLSGYNWIGTNAPLRNLFHLLQVTPLTSNALLTATVLNRLSYGPTPDELERVTAIGPDAFIAEQLNPETITETVDNTHTNLLYIFGKLALETSYLDLKRTYTYTTNSTNSSIITTNLTISSTNATIGDFRAWHTLRAVGARRQLLEILLQFLENHFVTQYTKTSTYFNGIYNGDNNIMEDRVATQLEFLENNKWRAALLNPQCTFYDLLRISAESPAMIIYLDTVASAGNANNIANENYARELLELFTFGVDNGYDQTDITVMSRAWTGWRVELVDPQNVGNPFALKTTNVRADGTNYPSATTNLLGCWTFNYKTNNHNNSAKKIFFNLSYTTNGSVITTNYTAKTVPARFGPPWAGNDYSLSLPGRSVTNGIQDGYDVLAHLANQPFTEEYICLKLCRLFVHDNFPNSSNDPLSPSYDLYNYAAGNLSPEADLVHQCMLAWETNSPKGQIRPVLQTLFNSSLFRGYGAAQQKVKTPLEFTVSTVRALRSSTNGTGNAGTFSAQSDGYSFATPLSRMGGMILFDRNDPNGYPEDAQGWISGGTLAERIRFAQAFCIASSQNGHSDAGNCISDPVALIRYKLPSTSWTNAAAVVDYFLGVLFPGEGAANLNLYRAAAVNFLNDGSADYTPSSTPFASLAVSNVARQPYDTRVRGMAALLLSVQRFQEQ